MIVSRKIQGASLIGCALIGGALLLNRLKSPHIVPTQNTLSALTSVPSNTYIPETDGDNNGIEDWREQFITTAPLITNTVTPTSTYKTPTSMTDQVGIQLIQSAIRNKAMGKSGLSTDKLVSSVTERVQTVAQDALYTKDNVKTITTDNFSVRSYGNSLGQSIISNNVTNIEDGLNILNQAVQKSDSESLKQLALLATMYKRLRDEAIATPVPDQFLTNHINLINAYNAMSINFDGMQLIFTDPMVALLRIKRYQNDTTYLAEALHAVYTELAAHESVFESSDPAVVFIAFSK